MIRLNIEKDGIEFKNLLSGPAPIGRILNYVYLAGTTGLFHRNGYRSLDFKDHIGYAWTTEFMIGLGILTLGIEGSNKTHLDLTSNGIKLFNLLNKELVFDEGTNESSLKTVKTQMDNCSQDLYLTYKRVFVESYPYQILKLYLEENGYHFQDKNVFMDDFFETVKELYDNDPAPYNRSSRTPTGQNRVPSLMQLCYFFGFLDNSDGTYTFDKCAFDMEGTANPHYTEQDVKEAVSNATYLIDDAVVLAEKYGIDGTVLAETVVRNSSLQRIFKTNLMLSQNEQCIMCGLSCRELLIGSHIKSSVESNAGEKADSNNGLLLCCNHDKLFDRYLITFDSTNGQIRISRSVSETDILLLGLEADYKLPEELLTQERRNYLSLHNQKFIEKETERNY